MTCFDEDPQDDREEYPCDCGGDISLESGEWICDSCGTDFRDDES